MGSLVGYGRRNFIVPVPSCSSFADEWMREEARAARARIGVGRLLPMSGRTYVYADVRGSHTGTTSDSGGHPPNG